jgi:zinc protease
VSDLPLAEVKAAFEKRFGAWKGEGAPGTKAFTVAPAQSAPKIVLVDRPDSPQSLILAGQMTSLVSSDELLPTVTANEVLGSGFLSRINMELRENKHWSYGAGGGYQRLEHAVPYVINAPVQADKTGESIKVLMTLVSEFLTTKGVTEAELTRNVNGDIRELAGRYETSGSVLTAMQFNDLLGRPDNYYDTIAQKYRALTGPQLDAAARKALDPNKFVWVVVGDAAKVKPQLDGIGLPVEVIPAKPAK